MKPEEKRAQQALRSQLATLLGREQRIATHLRGEDGRHEADFEDVASFVANDQVLEGLDEAARAETQQIRAALARLDAGTWGECTGCGGAVGAARLAALPHAALCVACATQAGA